jgi:hypothetical protein
MSDKIRTAVSQVEGLRDEVLSTVEALSDAQWQATTSSEGWPIGYTARHIAAGFRQSREWIEAACAGTPAQVDRAAIDASNAAGLATHGVGERQDVVEIVRLQAEALTNLLAGLNDALLDAPALVSTSGTRSVEAIVSVLLPLHTRNHLESIRTSVAAAAGG